MVNQTIGIEKIQIILVNDGSTDDSENICLKYEQLYRNNIVYIKIEHSGVSKARNIGLSYAKGIYYNFLDADDKWDLLAFNYAHLFFKLNKEIDIISGRLKFFESSNNYHTLDYKFYKTRKVNLTEEYNCIQLSASSSFFRASVVKGKKFKKGVFAGEDIRFINNILLLKPMLGIVKEMIYYYRKRSDSSSAIQTSAKKEDFYFLTINSVADYLINKSYDLYNKIQPFIQFYLGYEILWRITSQDYKILNSTNYKNYCSNIEGILKQIDDKYILEQKILSPKVHIFALSIKHNRDLRNELSIKNDTLIYSNYTMIDFKKKGSAILWRNMELNKNLLHLEGEDKCWLPREKYNYYCKIGNHKFFPKYYNNSVYNFKTLYGIIDKGRIAVFDIILKNVDIQSLFFYISYLGNDIQIFPSFFYLTHLSPLPTSYYATSNFIIKPNNAELLVYRYNKMIELSLEDNYCNQLKNLGKDYIIQVRKKYFNYRENTEKSAKIWLINDRKDKAGDNGEYFFRFLEKRNIKGIKSFFIIEKNCSDYERIKQYGNVIDLNSEEYLDIFLKADKIFSSVSDLWVNHPLNNDEKYIFDLHHFDFIYLQNGIIKDDLSQYINKIIKNFNLLLASSTKEYNSLLNDNYGYNKDNILLSGLPRFDELKSLQKHVKKEKLILIMPTWRNYITGTVDLVTYENIKSEYFKNTTYFKFYDSLINNEQLLNTMEKHNYKGIFCLHPNFAKQWSDFNKNNLISVFETCNYQELLVKSSLLITDYSSIFFDFGYIKKPIIYSQFDYEEYRSIGIPKGYFDYNNDGFGPVCQDINCTIKAINFEIENECLLKKLYKNRIKNFFTYFDEKNSLRVYRRILKNQYKKLHEEENIELYIIFPFIIFKFFHKISKLLF